MGYLNLFILAIVQGITEFLPVSSSAHLILAPMVAGFEDQGPLIDVAVHVGTLLAVIIAFRKEIAQVLKGLGHVLILRFDTLEGQLCLKLLLASIPALWAGYLLHSYGLMEAMRSMKLIGWTTLIYGFALWLADRYSPQFEKLMSISFFGAMLIGLSQALAFIPGTSRSGITMTTARFLGLTRPEAARFSMLLAIPLISAAGLVSALDIYQSGSWILGVEALMSAALAFVAAWVAIVLFMKWISKASMTPFVIYRFILGAILLWFAYS